MICQSASRVLVNRTRSAAIPVQIRLKRTLVPVRCPASQGHSQCGKEPVAVQCRRIEPTLPFLHWHRIDSALTAPTMAEDCKVIVCSLHCNALRLHCDWPATAQALGRDSRGFGRALRQTSDCIGMFAMPRLCGILVNAGRAGAGRRWRRQVAIKQRQTDCFACKAVCLPESCSQRCIRPVAMHKAHVRDTVLQTVRTPPAADVTM